MNSFYFTEKISSPSITITDSGQLHHIRNVLRLKTEDEVTVFDSQGTKYICRITGLNAKSVVLSIVSRIERAPDRLKIAIACAIPKKAKMDEIIDKLTQLNVDTIIPLVTERVIIKTGENENYRYERWQKIALNASEQSQRSRLPDIYRMTHFNDIPDISSGYDLKLIPTLEGERISLRKVMPEEPVGSIIVLIGPEGDFSPQEVLKARETGFIPVTLGDSVLRVDTAAVAVASFLSFYYQ